MSDPREQELRDLLAEMAGTDLSGLDPGDDLVKELGLDSLAGIRLLAAVEKRFGVRFPDGRLADFRTLRQLRDFVADKDHEEDHR